jgi:hypothetical protein
MMPKVQTTEGEKTDKLNFFKIKTFFSLKNTVKSMKKQAVGGENMFANHVCD